MADLRLTAQEVEALRPYLFTPCDTEEDLHNWITAYIGWDIPNTLVDPNSTISPMGLIWLLYSAAKDGRESEVSEVLAMASRDSYKTIVAALLEVLFMAHLERSSCHMAAIKPQSKKAQSYLKKFLNRPLLREYVTSENDTSAEITRYRHYETKVNLPFALWSELLLAERDQYEEIKKHCGIVICTVAGANSAHETFMCIDEIDVIQDPQAYEESKMIPAPEHDKLPITLLTSSRKFSWSLVQKELDNAVDSGLVIHHWSILDVTRKCMPERHLPDESTITIYSSDKHLKAIDEKAYGLLDTKSQKEYQKYESQSAGCLSRCKLFSVCQGRLKHQTGSSPFLKPIPHVQKLFGKVSIDTAKSQLLCLKPSTEGLVYSTLNRNVHMKSAAEIAQMITGEVYPEIFTKSDLINLFVQRGHRPTAGLDFGYTHNLAKVWGFRVGINFFVLTASEIAELDPAQQMEVCQPEKELKTAWYADTAYPGSIKMFQKAGFIMRDWSKTPGSVVGGIDIVRLLLAPPLGVPPRLYFLKEDDGVGLLFKRLSEYHWKLDSQGNPTDIPDDTNDDLPDSIRYLLMNEFANKGKVIAAIGDSVMQSGSPINSIKSAQVQQVKTPLSDILNELLTDNSSPISTTVKSKGRIKW